MDKISRAASIFPPNKGAFLFSVNLGKPKQKIQIYCWAVRSGGNGFPIFIYTIFGVGHS
mgnify:CR=1 FL=1